MFDFYYHRLIFMSQDRGTFPPTGIPFKISYFLLILKKSQLVFKKMPPLILQQAYRSNQNKTSMVLPIYVMTDILTAWHSRITKSFWMKTLWKLKPQLITLLWYLLHPNLSIWASESMKIRENPTVAWILLRKCRNVDVLEDFTDLVDLFGFKKCQKKRYQMDFEFTQGSVQKYFVVREYQVVKNSVSTYVWSTWMLYFGLIYTEPPTIKSPLFSQIWQGHQ